MVFLWPPESPCFLIPYTPKDSNPRSNCSGRPISEEPQRDKLSRVGPQTLGQFLKLARRASQSVVELRVHHQLSDGALSGVDLVHHAIDLDGQLVEARLQLAQFGERTLACVDRSLQIVK